MKHRALTIWIVFLWVCLRAQSSYSSFSGGSVATSPDTFVTLTRSINKYAAGKTTAALSYGSALQLATNQSVWTWPLPLSCVGLSAGGFQITLLAPNAAVSCGDHPGGDGNSLTLCDTNGVYHIARFISTNSIGTNIGGFLPVIYVLESNLPPSIVTPWILPRGDYTNKFMWGYGFWAHKNTAQVEANAINNNPPHTGFFHLTMTNGAALTFLEQNPATGGDSGSPAFCVIDNKPVFLWSGCESSDFMGYFISDRVVYDGLVALIDTNTLKIIPPSTIADYAP